MQYPEIQFYRGSLVRLASGRLKQVEDLSSDDFLESARLSATATKRTPTIEEAARGPQQHNCPGNNSQRMRFDFSQLTARHRHRAGAGSSGTLDENNNSVFNSPEPTSNFDDSPRMETDEEEDRERDREREREQEEQEEEEIEVELDVVSHDDDEHEPAPSMLRAQLSGHEPAHQHQRQPTQGLNLTSHSVSVRNLVKAELGEQAPRPSSAAAGHELLEAKIADEQQEFYIDSSVVRDFLEVAPIQLAASGAHQTLPTSPTSSTDSLSNQDLQHQQPHLHRQQRPHHQHGHQLTSAFSASCDPRRGSSSSSLSPSSPPVVIAPGAGSGQTVLVKFFLEASRSVAFIEVPIEHPFFVLHRGWSSWSPQRTYDKFGLKCRKLKIGDTCISLIRRRRASNLQQESDHCNLMLSSIKINE